MKDDGVLSCDPSCGCEDGVLSIEYVDSGDVVVDGVET